MGLPKPVAQLKTASPSGATTRPSDFKLLLATLLLVSCAWQLLPSFSSSHVGHRRLPQCPAQPAPLKPTLSAGALDWRPESDPSWIMASADRLSGAVRIPTVSDDDMATADLEKDPRYVPFGHFRQYLADTFPGVHRAAKREVVNHHALLFTVQGSDPSLKPGLFLAHQDVVPVPDATLDQWEFSPFDGHFEVLNQTTGEGRVWGRGSSDDKNMLMGIFEAFEQLFQEGWQPERTFYLAFGFDEEIGGPRGAKVLGEHLLQRLGPNSLHFVLDEGGLGISNQHGIDAAMVATAEKGYADIGLAVEVAGGHSSMPTDHTAIGIMAHLLTELEKRPHEPVLDEQNPMLTHYSCIADAIHPLTHEQSTLQSLQHFIQRFTAVLSSSRVATGTPGESRFRMTKSFIRDLRSGQWEACARRIASEGDKVEKYVLTTSQAIDVIAGGRKANALPEQVTALINHRVGMSTSTEDVVQRLESIVRPIAEDVYGLDFLTATQHEEGALDSAMLPNPAKGRVVVTVPEPRTEHSRISPTDTEAWNTFSATIKHVFKAAGAQQEEAPGVLVTPVIMTGNTDVRRLVPLSENLWRWNPGKRGFANDRIHTVNENMDSVIHAQVARFIWTLARNMDH